MDILKRAYPWLKSPLVVSAPMLRIAGPALTVAVSQAGGLGFLAGGFDVSDLETNLSHAAALLQSAPPRPGLLPIGLGFLTWGASLDRALPLITKYSPAAVWLFGASTTDRANTTYATWVSAIRSKFTTTESTTTATGIAATPQIWIQIGSVSEALHVMRTARPDVLVVQGTDAGGHGAARSASIISLVPEVHDALAAAGFSHIPLVAAGGIADARGLAAAVCLGAAGAVMGTRFLACTEANISRGYQREVLRVSDGGTSTVRTTVYDRVRGFNEWPADYDGRGVMNRSWQDAEAGMEDEENVRLYKLEMEKGDEGWGPEGRMTTYAGTDIGLVKEVKPAAEIVAELREGASRILRLPE
jgi:nitronate monooxygenase